MGPFILKLTFLQEVKVAHLLVKESPGYAGCFYSARQERLPDWVRGQICCEAGAFEMVQHILLGENLEHLSSFFSGPGISHTAHVLVMVSGDRCHQRDYPAPEEHLQTTAERRCWLPQRKCVTRSKAVGTPETIS